MNNHDPSDRVQVRSRGELQLPGACALCGSGNNDDGYVDFNLWFEFHGTFYLCFDCFGEAAQLVGYVVPEIAAHIQETNETLAEELAQTKAELEKANELLLNWNTVISSINGSATALLGNLPNDVVGSPEGTDEAAGSVTGDAGEAGGDEPKSPEPVKGKRPPKPVRSESGDGSTPEFTL